MIQNARRELVRTAIPAPRDLRIWGWLIAVFTRKRIVAAFLDLLNAKIRLPKLVVCQNKI